jgi:hypothetical protein
MTDRVCGLHHLRRLAKVGVRTGGIDDGVDLTLADDGAGVHCPTWLGSDWQRLSGQCRLIHLDRIAIQQPRICGNDVAQPETNDIARHQITRLGILPLAISLDLGLDR